MYCSKLTEQAVVSSSAPIAETKYGRIAGIKKEGAYIFRGIKYADAQRFRLPQEIKPWDETKAAVSYGYVCPELFTPVALDQQMNPHYYMPQDENCQYLDADTGPEGKKTGHGLDARGRMDDRIRCGAVCL